MIYSRHKEDAGRDRRVSSRKWGLLLPSAEWACCGFFFSKWSACLVSKEEVAVELRSHVVNLVRTVSAYYLPKRPIAPSLDFSPDKMNKRDLGEQTDP